VLRLPGTLAGQIGDVLDGRKEPAAPKDAATVLLLRPPGGDPPGPVPPGGGAPGGSGLEVFLLRRARSMAFAPGASAFPGGSVDPRDAEEQVAWAGPDAAAWGASLDAPPALARALVCSAAR